MRIKPKAAHFPYFVRIYSYFQTWFLKILKIWNLIFSSKISKYQTDLEEILQIFIEQNPYIDKKIYEQPTFRRS